MSEEFGPDFITITDEDGVEYVLEVLSVLEVDGNEYYALVPAEDDDSQEDLEVTILKVTEENGEEILCAIEDEQELQKEWFEGKKVCGITAGASTPDWIISKVQQEILSY